MPKVSILLTSYNHEKYIEECIESVLNQSYKDFELFIVDDCSTDKSWKIINSYKDKRIIKIKNDKNLNDVIAKDIIDKFKGEYFAIIHSDDTWHPTKLKTQVEFLDKNKEYAACFTGANLIDENSNEFTNYLHPLFDSFPIINLTRQQWINRLFIKKNCLCHPSCMIRTKIQKDLNLYTKGLGSYPDYYRWIKLVFYYNIYVLEDRLTNFRIKDNDDNTSGINYKNIIRCSNEDYYIAGLLYDIKDKDLFASFPEAYKYVVNEKYLKDYIVSMILINSSFKQYKLRGLNKLYNMVNDEKISQDLSIIHNFTQKDFIELSSQINVWDVSVENTVLLSSLYYSKNKVFSEENKISKQIYLNNGKFYIRFTILNIDFDKFRFDPCEGKLLKFRDLCIKIDNKIINYSIERKYENRDNWTYIYSLDPAITFSANKDTKIIEISGQVANVNENETLNFYENKNYRKFLHYKQPKTKKISADLCIVDEIFPSKLSGHTYIENTALLKYFKNSKCLVSGKWAQSLSQEPFDKEVYDYKKAHPKLKHKIIYNHNQEINGKLLYCNFLNTAYECLLPQAEANKIPFIFTLYPGGAFYLNIQSSDYKLKKLFSSKFFKKVIVTQKITYDYLIKNKFCEKNQIEYIFGVVSEISNEYNINNRHYYKNGKDSLDICFAAHKYTQYGIDKGFDKVISVANKLYAKYNNIKFHIIGPWNNLDVSPINNNVTFYDSMDNNSLKKLYENFDIIISPNIPFIMHDGAFDGFPTSCCTDASSKGCVMMTSDVLGLNANTFTENKEIITIKPDIEDIYNKIVYLYENPNKIKEIGINGMHKCKKIYNYGNQLMPRIKLLESYIKD